MKTIVAIPSLCDDEDFDLADPAKNRRKLTGLMARRPTQWGDDNELGEGLVLYRLGTPGGTGGSVFLTATDPGGSLIAYFMEYKRITKSVIGSSVTQTKVWRARGMGVPSGFVQGMMLGPLLDEFGAVMSDRLQTEDGKDLWVDFMGLALREKLHVALVDLPHRQVRPLRSSSDLREWSADTKGAGPWAWHSRKHQGLRFLISKKPIPNVEHS
jgi:hypothetical protein